MLTPSPTPSDASTGPPGAHGLSPPSTTRSSSSSTLRPPPADSVLANRVLLSRSGIAASSTASWRTAWWSARSARPTPVDPRLRSRPPGSTASGGRRGPTGRVARYFLDIVGAGGPGRRRAGLGRRGWLEACGHAVDTPARAPARPDHRRVPLRAGGSAGTSGFAYAGWAPRFYPPGDKGSRAAPPIRHAAAVCKLDDTSTPGRRWSASGPGGRRAGVLPVVVRRSAARASGP